MIINSIKELEKLDKKVGSVHMLIAFEDGEVCSSKMIFTSKGNKVSLSRSLHQSKPVGFYSYPTTQLFNLEVNDYKAFIIVGENDREELESLVCTKN